MKKSNTTGAKRRPASANNQIENNGVINTIKKVKTRIREEKEMKKLFETIAERLLNENKYSIVTETENRCRDMLARTIADIRHEIFNIESSVSTRIVNLEGKLNVIHSRIDEIQLENNKKLCNLQEEISALSKESKVAVENERNKRLTTLKKIHDQYDANLNNLQQAVNQNKTESTNAVNALNEDLRVHSKELASLKDKLDEILIKQYGYLPHSKVGQMQMHQGGQAFDASGVLDGITQRLQRLEVAVSNDDELNGSFELLNTRGTPIRTAITNKSGLGRVRKLEEHMLELQSQIKENEIDIQHLKNNLVHNLRSQGGSTSPIRERYRDASKHHEDNGCHYNGNGGASYSDMKEMDRRIKKLAENTSKACRSLSNGLTEVQQATLNLYAWSDEVHAAFDRVAVKVDLPNNLCPRAKVSSRNNMKLNKFEFS